MAVSLSFVCLLSALCSHFVSSDEFVQDVNAPRKSLDLCSTECFNKVSLNSNAVISADSCSRGCRFFRISQLLDEGRLSDQNSSREACKNMCRESYNEDNFELLGCTTGCDVSSKMLPIPVVAELSFSFFVESGNSLQILQDLSEPDEILTDPGLREQVSRIETLHIPEIRMRTLPVVQDKEVVESVSGWWNVGNSGCGWIRGVPHCLVGSLLLLLILLALWFGLSLDEKAEESKELPEKVPLPTV